jgi:MFS superfamily sulfate permease-like transporter
MARSHFLPEWLRSYERSWLRTDLLAGLAAWAVLVPLALSIAAIAGVDPVVGLYGIPLALAGYAFFGGQRILVMGPDAAIAILSGNIIASVADSPAEYLALTTLLALIVGVVFLVFWILRMGWTADLVPDPVLKGFTEGIIWLTIAKQSVMLFGLDPDQKPSGALEYMIDVRRAVSDVSIPTAMVGGLSISALVLMRLYRPKWPGPLIVLVGSIAVSSVLGLGDRGVAILGTVEGGLPSLNLTMRIDASEWMTLLSGALAMVVLGFAKALPALQKASDYSGDRMTPNRELLGLGIANIGAALGGGHALGASLTATSISGAAGARSQIGNLFAALLCVVTIVALLPLLHNLPLATLASIIVVALGGISNLRYFRRIFAISGMEFLGGAAAFVGVLAFGVLPGVLIGVVLAFFVLARAIHNPVTVAVGRTASGGFIDLDEHPEAKAIPGMLILHQYGPLVYLNARMLAGSLREAALASNDIRVVVLDATASSGLDTSAATRIASVAEEMTARGIEFWIVNSRRQGRMVVDSLLADKKPIAFRYFPTLQDAVAFFESRPT